MPDVLAFGIVLDDVIGTITIGYVDVAIGCHSSFCGTEGFVIFVHPNGARMPDVEDDSAGKIGFDHLPGLAFPTAVFVLVITAVYDQQEIFAAFFGESQTVPAGKGAAPMIQQSPRFIKNQDVVVRIVAQHDQAALAVLYHFVAVEQGRGVDADFGPAFVYFVGEAAVPDDGVFGLELRVQNGKPQSGGGYNSCGGKSGVANEFSAWMHSGSDELLIKLYGLRRLRS